MSQSLWGGRFKGALDPAIAVFNRSFAFDRELFRDDATASRAWAGALGRAGVLSAEDTRSLQSALDKLLQQADSDPNFWGAPDRFEDVHSFLEFKLGELTGDAAKRLHSGRSRNDQVATAFRLWTRRAVDKSIARVRSVQRSLLDLAAKTPEAPLPGYTHLQRAQPVLFGHWCLAYFEMLRRDVERLGDLRKRVNVMPLGSGALAGSSAPVDREQLARDLNFGGITRNSLDAVSDRDFLVEFELAAALGMTHLSRLAEDIILYSSQEFAFFELGDAVSTGSSLMPQKKNPDPMELVRGKSGRVFGHLMGTLTMLKGLPLAYNKDMQEDKEAAFDTFATLDVCMEATAVMLCHLGVRTERMQESAQRGYLNATEMADYLVRKGQPFRAAHETAGRLVLEAVARGVEIEQLPLELLQTHFAGIEKDVFDALSLGRTLASKNVPGGTAPNRVREALAEARQSLA
ncbi:MAG: argininosuccinate lyase [Bdellovibrionales bacterium]|nr:argininosuccinate lyase [Bdellovibrionales bacterium]